jgi:hypothetical protein
MQNRRDADRITEDVLLTYGAYVRVAASLQHSNRIQMTYKGLTITWLLATFIGIGYTLSSIEVSLPFNHFLIVTALCVASAFVIGLIWYLDLFVQEKKIASAVHSGLSLENLHPWLPRAYHNVVHMHYLFSYVAMKSVFYVGSLSILIFTICASISAFLYNRNFSFWWIILIVMICLISFLLLFSRLITKKTDPYPLLEKLQKKDENRRI